MTNSPQASFGSVSCQSQNGILETSTAGSLHLCMDRTLRGAQPPGLTETVLPGEDPATVLDVSVPFKIYRKDYLLKGQGNNLYHMLSHISLLTPCK